ALAIERQTPGGVQNRLINAVQLGRAEGDGLASALVRENYDTLRQTSLPACATSRPALLRVGLAGAVVLVGVAFWVLWPEHFANAASRILMPLSGVEPIYRTRLSVEPGDVEAEGDVTIRIRISGERPEALTVFRRVEGRQLQERVEVPKDADEVEYT